MDKHSAATQALQEGRTEDACRLINELLLEHETSELWNDWATIQYVRNDSVLANKGFARALQLDPQNHQAKANLGLLLLRTGDRQRGITLIQDSLNFLDPQQSEALRSMVMQESQSVAGPAASEPSRQQAEARDPLQQPSAATASADIPKKAILVIADTFPVPDATGSDPNVLQILRTLTQRHHLVTFIAREATTSANHETALRGLGIQSYSNDAERMAALGSDVPPRTWSFDALLAETSFDLAILTQDFARGISVPEQYLDDIRRVSPSTRIAILSGRLHDRAVSREANSTTGIENEELTNDLHQRELEAFSRADLALVPTSADAGVLRLQDIPVNIAVLFQADQPTAANALEQQLAELPAIVPKAANAQPFSMLRAESVFGGWLQKRTGKDRTYAQLDCYVRLAENLLREKKANEALEQLRHIFGHLRAPVDQPQFLPQVLALFTRCYREIGEPAMAERCADRARRCVIEHAATTASTATAPAIKRSRKGPSISLIVPSYNRLPILRKCLVALEAQTISPKKFEVIVIDDGSSDGTEEAMQHYQPAFNFRYLRQKNSGTGAARCNGVNHATGDYLLLMNDDTILAPDAIEQHLAAHRSHSWQQWAVLGNFEYPVEARQRALTHFFCVEPFMFPQVTMEAGCPYGYSHFITCNLSVRRDAVVKAGSFDPIYKLSEDTELGLRLFERGYRVLYHPAAHAWHDHLPYTVRNLIRRARVYGADYFYMFRRHPRVMKEWGLPVPLSGLDAQNAAAVQNYIQQNRAEIEAAVAAVERWDSINFEPFLASNNETASLVLQLFRQAIPAIHWFYLYESMYEMMEKELGLIPSMNAELPAVAPIAMAAHEG